LLSKGLSFHEKLEGEVRDTFKIVIGILLLINLAACDALPDDKPPVLPKDQSWVIITKERAEELGIESWLIENDDFWTPSVDDITKLEEKIAEYLSQNSHQFYGQPPVWEQLDEYQRQYIGLEHAGQQLIYGNYFCNSGGVNWREELVVVDDGGDCFFQIEYDVESEAFIKLLVNGVS
jgi:hypothetical protein